MKVWRLREEDAITGEIIYSERIMELKDFNKKFNRIKDRKMDPIVLIMTLRIATTKMVKFKLAM